MKTVFVTPSYRGDFERCKLLCESTSIFIPNGIEHLLIIDRRDVHMFRSLENDTVRIVESEQLIPWWIFRVPGLSNWRASLKGLPVRNWIYQQLLKIGISNLTDAEIINFLDSDVALIKPIDVPTFYKDGLVRLQHVRFESAEHRNWINIAKNVLNIDEHIEIDGNFVGNFITWKRSNVLKMIDHIQRVNQKDWHSVLASQITFSEYMLYGSYVEGVVGIEKSGHFLDSSENLHCCWHQDLSNIQTLNNFFEGVSPNHFGIMIHSKDGLPVSAYRSRVEKLWNR